MTDPLPKGITHTYVKGKTYYRVRFMVEGARINLGTFASLPLATAAMTEWKIKDMLRAANNLPKGEDIVKDAIKEVTTDHYGDPLMEELFSKLSEMPSALLSPAFDAVTSDGTTVPKLIVARYLNNLYGEL